MVKNVSFLTVSIFFFFKLVNNFFRNVFLNVQNKNDKINSINNPTKNHFSHIITHKFTDMNYKIRRLCLPCLRILKKNSLLRIHVEYFMIIFKNGCCLDHIHNINNMITELLCQFRNTKNSFLSVL